MKTSPLFTAILATALFAANAQAQSVSASGNAQASAQGSMQADTAAAKAAAAKSAQAAANAQGRASGALQQIASGTAQASSNASAQASAQGSAAADTLAQRYAEAAGSVDAAADIVGDLHAGTGDHAAMAYGEIDTTLALASQLVADNEAANLDAAVDAVLDLRADGLGFGQIAQELGYNLGGVVSAAHSTSAQAAQGVTGTVSSALSAPSNVSANKQIGVNVGESRASIGADAAASGKAERPSAADLRANGRINVGADVRPSLPLVRPLLGR